MRVPALVLAFSAISIGTMCLFPPYIREGVSARRNVSLNKGYAFILAWPRARKFNTGHSDFAIKYKIDGIQLLGQISYIAAATICASILFNSTHLTPKSKTSNKRKQRRNDADQLPEEPAEEQTEKLLEELTGELMEDLRKELADELREKITEELTEEIRAKLTQELAVSPGNLGEAEEGVKLEGELAR